MFQIINSKINWPVTGLRLLENMHSFHVFYLYFSVKMSSKACQNCGGTDIDVDPARGIAVCTNCGVVLEENCIVSEVQFEENAYGGASAIGQFVSNDNQGGTGFINSYRGGNGKLSREITLKRAREKITTMGQQLRYYNYNHAFAYTTMKNIPISLFQ